MNNTTTIDKSTVNFLLSRFMDTEYQTKFLAKVSADNLQALHNDLTMRFDDLGLELTVDDVKDAWKNWFDWAANNGTLLSPDFRIVDPNASYRHAELEVLDKLLELVFTAIDTL